MDYLLETRKLGKRYGRKWALQNCSLQIPPGRVVGLVGLNGSGKTTLMHSMMGLIRPTWGSIRVLNQHPSRHDPEFLACIGFVAQERPLYRHFSVRDMLTLGKKLNITWDNGLAQEALGRLQIPLGARIDKLAGGQQVLVALVMALAKKPELILLDEPLANVDPIARREFMKILMEAVAVDKVSVMISSHIVTDLDSICDYLIILSASQVQVSGDIETVLAHHKLLIGPREEVKSILGQCEHTMIQAKHSERQSTLVVRASNHIPHYPLWDIRDMTLEEIVLAYLDMQGNNVQVNSYSEQEITQ